MKKILFFIPTLTGGGAEKVLVNLVNNMDKQKYNITVMTLFNVGVNIEYLNEDIEYKYVFKKLFRGNIHIFKLFSPEFLFKRIIKEEYDVIISYLQGPTTRIVSGCRNKDTKLVNWMHNEIDDIKKIMSSYRNKTELIKCYKKYDSTVFVAETVKESFNKIMPRIDKGLKVLYNTVDSDEIKMKSIQKIEDIKYDSNKINLISVGRFAHQKGYERLLKIASKLVKDDKLDIHLYLLGKGELEEKYKQIIDENDIERNVSFLGYKINPYKYVKNSDLFVCSSYHEGYSTAVTESLIVGTPIITTNCSGMEEMLGSNNEYGIIVNNTDEDLYDGLRNILNNKDKIKKLKEKAIYRGKFFDKNKTVKEVELFIDTL